MMADAMLGALGEPVGGEPSILEGKRDPAHPGPALRAATVQEA
jgi:hypothetical protein